MSAIHKAIALGAIIVSCLFAPGASAQLVFVGPIVPGDDSFPPGLVVIAQQWPEHNCAIEYSFDLGWGDIQTGPTFNSCYPDDGYVAAIFDTTATNAWFRSWQTPCAQLIQPAANEAGPIPARNYLRDYRFVSRRTHVVYRFQPVASQFVAHFPFREIRRFRLVPVTQ